MKRSIACLLASLCLLAVWALPGPTAAESAALPDLSLLPETTFAVVVSPGGSNETRVFYALYGLEKDEETLQISVRQISSDPDKSIYEEAVDSEKEQDIRARCGFTKDQPIVGSYCEAVILRENPGEDSREKWSYCKQNSVMPHGQYMDETFTFLLSEMSVADDRIVLEMCYGCITVPGAAGKQPLCTFTIDIADYLKPVTTGEMSKVDPALLPEDTAAVLLSSLDHDAPKIVYVIYGIIEEEGSITVSVRQISTDPDIMLYDDYAVNVDENHIRQVNELPLGQPIAGSYCELYMEKDPAGEGFTDRWLYPAVGSGSSCGYFIEEKSDFSLRNMPEGEGKRILRMDFNCIPVPGTLEGHNTCCMTMDVAAYLN